MTGASYSQIGEWSRFFHATQGMGRWRDPGPESWPLHLARSTTRANAEDDVTDGLPATVGALAGEPGTPAPMAKALGEAQAAIDAAVGAFPDGAAITEAALRAAAAIDAAQAACPPRCKPRVAHRLARKAQELDAVLHGGGRAFAARLRRPVAAGARPTGRRVGFRGHGRCDKPTSRFRSTGRNGMAVGSPVMDGAAHLFPLSVAPDAAFTDPYTAAFDPLAANGDLAVDDLGQDRRADGDAHGRSGGAVAGAAGEFAGARPGRGDRQSGAAARARRRWQRGWTACLPPLPSRRRPAGRLPTPTAASC